MKFRPAMILALALLAHRSRHPPSRLFAPWIEVGPAASEPQIEQSAARRRRHPSSFSPVRLKNNFEAPSTLFLMCGKDRACCSIPGRAGWRMRQTVDVVIADG